MLQLANILFEGLFGVRLFEPRDEKTKLVGEFIASWAEFDQALSLRRSAGHEGHMPLIDHIRRLRTSGVLTASELATLESLRRMRNQVVHAQPNKDVPLTQSTIELLRAFSQKIRKASMAKSPSQS